MHPPSDDTSSQYGEDRRSPVPLKGGLSSTGKCPCASAAGGADGDPRWVVNGFHSMPHAVVACCPGQNPGHVSTRMSSMCVPGSGRDRRREMSLLDERSWTEKIFVSDWTKGGAGAQDVVEPATGEVLGRIGVASTDDVERARSRAPASESGRTCGPRNAPPCCGAPATCGSSTARRSASGWCARQDRSRPKPDWSVRRRRRSVTKQPRYRQHPAGHVLPSAEPRWSLARRRPVGVVTVIAPFNFPLILSIRS